MALERCPAHEFESADEHLPTVHSGAALTYVEKRFDSRDSKFIYFAIGKAAWALRANSGDGHLLSSRLWQ
jgi:hypothetical protein